MAAIVAFAGFFSTNVVVVSVVALIASLNVAVTLVVIATPVAPLAGETTVTVGGVVSADVVNDQTKLLTSALPAASLTPPAPLITVAV